MWGEPFVPYWRSAAIRPSSVIAERSGGGPMATWLVIHLICIAVFLDLCDRAPEIG
jgi:hypothetical protein